MKKILSFFVILLLVLSSVNVSFGAESCKTEEISNASNLVYSPYGNNYAYILTKDNGKQVVVRDGVEGKEYDLINYLIYSPDGKSFAYYAETKRNVHHVIVKDGYESKEYDVKKRAVLGWGLSRGVVIKYSLDSKSFVFYAYKKGNFIKKGIWIKVKDGVEINNLKPVQYEKKRAYRVIKENGKSLIVTDGVEGKEYNRVGNSVYSLNGKPLSYIATKENGKKVIVIGGVEGKEYYYIDYMSDVGVLSYIATKKNGKKVVVIDGIESSEWNDIYYIKYSQDNKSYFFVVKTNGGKYIVVKDGVQSQQYDKIGFAGYLLGNSSLIFDGKKINGKWVRVKNGIEGKEYYNIKNLPGGVTSKYFTYMAMLLDSFKWVIVRDGVEGNSYDKIYTYNNMYSPDGKVFIYNAEKDGRSFLVKNGIEGKKYDIISNLVYSQGGKSFTYTAQINGKFILIKETCIGINSLFNIQKSKPQLVKQLILSKRELKKSFKGKSYIYKIDLIVKKLPKVKLERLMGKLKKIDTNLVKFRKYKNMLDYLEAKVGLELLK